MAGPRFDTSALKAAGNRSSERVRSAGGYVVRHPEGLEEVTMFLPVLLLLLLSAFAGLAAGRYRTVAAAAIAVIPCALLGGLETAGLALLAAAGLAAGVHLHRVVAEHSLPRAG